MTDADISLAAADEAGWPQRTVLLLVIGALAALAIQQLIAPEPWSYNQSLPVWRTAGAAAIGVGALAFGFGLSRIRIAWSIAFAIALGVVAGLSIWWNGEPQEWWNWSGASLFLAIAIAVPLFQTARDAGGRAFPYPQVHRHAWTNVVLWGACWAFTGIVLLLSHLLAELFALIGLNFVKEMLGHNWSNTLIMGAAFGAALGMLRDRDRVVGLLQRVVTSVLSVLAPVLGVALILFILSLPFTGLGRLWEATRSTTPILIACVIGALVLANAVIGHGPDDETRSPALRWSALALGVAVLPLAVIAAIAMGLRIGQYGMTPDRLWGLVVVAFAVAYGVVYFVDVVRGRENWGPLVRRDNIRLAFATMAVALVLATPILGFNAISTRDQVARLQSGRVKPADFDWAALAFDFGDPGRRALTDLRRSSDTAIAQRAAQAATSDNRFEVAAADQRQRESVALRDRLRILPTAVALPERLRTALTSYDACGPGAAMCVVLYRAGATEAWAMQGDCFKPAQPGRAGATPAGRCAPKHLVFTGRDWQAPDTDGGVAATAAPARQAALAAGKIEVRTVPRRQLFIGDEPVGDPFE